LAVGINDDQERHRMYPRIAHGFARRLFARRVRASRA
jgi:hypothetical protein